MAISKLYPSRRTEHENPPPKPLVRRHDPEHGYTVHHRDQFETSRLMETGYCPIQSRNKLVIARIVGRTIAFRFGVPRKDRQHRQAEARECSHEILWGRLRLKIAFLGNRVDVEIRSVQI